MLPNFPFNIQRVHRTLSVVCRKHEAFFEQIRVLHSCVSLKDEVSRSTMQFLYKAMFGVHWNGPCYK